MHFILCHTVFVYSCYIDFRILLWSSLLVVYCPVLTPPENGFFIQDVCNNHFEAACGVRCQSGFELHGTSIRLCQADGTWSGIPASCTGKEEILGVISKCKVWLLLTSYSCWNSFIFWKVVQWIIVLFSKWKTNIPFHIFRVSYSQSY